MISPEEIGTFARRLGFDAFGITPAGSIPHAEAEFQSWIEAGLHGSMKYLENYAERKKELERELPGAKNVLVFGASYYTAGETKTDSAGLTGRVARYAWGKDYHLVIREKLKAVEDFIHSKAPEAKCLTCVDTRPIFERSYAELAGLGFRGKHTNLLSREFGPWLFLSEIITDLDFAPDKSADHGSCGICTDCLGICPTRAIVEPGKIDARKCIAYLTIEHKGVIPREIRPLMGDWVFGCDACLNVCPFTRFSKESTWKEFHPSSGAGERLGLLELFKIKTNGEYESRFSDTPLLRATRKMMLRNAAVVLGNIGGTEAVPVLAKALLEEVPLVKIHAAWALGQLSAKPPISLPFCSPSAGALGQLSAKPPISLPFCSPSAGALGRIGGEEARRALESALQSETDSEVREEILLGLQ